MPRRAQCEGDEVGDGGSGRAVAMATIGRGALSVSQFPERPTVHRIWGRGVDRGVSSPAWNEIRIVGTT